MQMRLLLSTLIAGFVFYGIAFELHASSSGDAAYDMAVGILEVGEEALAKDNGGPMWQEIDRRLHQLFDSNTKQADEAAVILMSFYLGEHNGEELRANLLKRGVRLIPILDRYLHQEPLSLIERYSNKRVRLDRPIAVAGLREVLEILRVRSGARRVARASFDTAPLRQETGECIPKLLHHPEIKPGEELVQPGESYDGAPVLRATILESGAVTNVQVLSRSGVQRLDALLSSSAGHLKYAPRPHCGNVQVNIVIFIDWMPPQ